MYRQVMLTVVYKSLYLHTGVLNYGTVKHILSLHTYWENEVNHVYVRLSDGDWSTGACRLFYSLWLKATEQSTCAHTSYFSTLQKINHFQGEISTITQLPFFKHWQEPEYFNHFVSSCILKVTTHSFTLHSQVWQMFTTIMEALN